MVRVTRVAAASDVVAGKRAAAVAARARLRVAACVRKPPAASRRAAHLSARFARGGAGGGGALGSPARCAKARFQTRTRAAVASPPISPSAPLDADAKVLLRKVLRSVHPDKYMANPRAREINSASLQRLNGYVDAMSRGDRPRCGAQSLRFLVSDGGAAAVSGSAAALREVLCVLPPGGSLKPLFAAFSLTRRSMSASPRRGGMSPRTSPRKRRASASRDAELLEWLGSHLGEASTRRELYQSRGAGLAAAKAALEAEFGLRHLRLGFIAESATAEPLHLAALAEALRCFSAEQAGALAGAHIVLCDAQEVPAAGVGGAKPPRAASEDGRFQLAEDGTLWLSLCADWRPLWRFLRAADLAWAAQAGAAAAARAADAEASLPRLAALLRVKHIYAPTTLRPEPLCGFCASLSDAAAVLAASPIDAAACGSSGGAFGFGLHVCAAVSPGTWDLAWADASGRTLVAYAFGQRSVFVAADCPPWALAHFLAQHGTRIDAERASGDARRAALEGVQAALRAALGVTLGTSVLLPEAAALASAERLLAVAPELRAAVGEHLAGARLMIVDDADANAFVCLANGTLCIPLSWRVEEVLRVLLQQRADKGGASAAGAGAGAGAGAR
jgi:hypothetical protein